MRRPGIYLRFVLLWSSRKNQHASERCRAKRKDEVMDQRATIAELKQHYQNARTEQERSQLREMPRIANNNRNMSS